MLTFKKLFVGSHFLMMYQKSKTLSTSDGSGRRTISTSPRAQPKGSEPGGDLSPTFEKGPENLNVSFSLFEGLSKAEARNLWKASSRAQHGPVFLVKIRYTSSLKTSKYIGWKSIEPGQRG